ncbi:MAG: hypothetical protein ACTSUE_20865 [Promethearchaeota archaeon]
MLRSLFIYDNKNGIVLFQYLNDEFSKNHEELVVNFLRAIDTFSSQYSGKGADVFQTESIRITFERSLEFNLTFASCTDMSNPIETDKEILETIKYAFIHQYWEFFTSDKRAEINEKDKDKFLSLIKSI